jgi:hypothetical protein
MHIKRGVAAATGEIVELINFVICYVSSKAVEPK